VKHSILTLLISFATSISEAPKLIQVDGFCVSASEIVLISFYKVRAYFFLSDYDV
jgi:hypothetical protein